MVTKIFDRISPKKVGKEEKYDTNCENSKRKKEKNVEN